MKANFLLGLMAIIIAVACEKEVNIFVPGDEPCTHTDTTIIIYQDNGIRIEASETDKETEDCKYGQITFTVYKDEAVFQSVSYCRESDSVIVIQNPDTSRVCPQYWDYISSVEKGICDTLYNYDCDWNLNFKIPICKPALPDTFIITLPGDTVIVTLPGDTVHIYDTIRITDEIAYVIFPLLYEDCDKGSSPYYHNVLNWTVLETGFSINAYMDDGQKNEHGAIVFHDINKDSGVMFTPYLSSPLCQDQLPNLYAACLYSGSRISSEQQFWVMYEDGSIEKIKSGKTRINSDFEWSKHYDKNTWSRENLFFFKEDNLKNPKASGIIKVGVGYKKTENQSILCRNDKYNADELRIWGYKLIHQ